MGVYDPKTIINIVNSGDITTAGLRANGITVNSALSTSHTSISIINSGSALLTGVGDDAFYLTKHLLHQFGRDTTSRDAPGKKLEV